MTNSDVCVLAADAAKARCFLLEEDNQPGSESLKLAERQVWVHPEARMTEHERYQDSNPRGSRSGASGKTYAFDDHREAHDEDDRRKFAVLVADALAGILREHANSRVVVCATHSMVSHFKHAFERGGLAAGKIDWVTAEVAERSAHSLHEYLADKGLLRPPRAPRLEGPPSSRQRK